MDLEEEPFRDLVLNKKEVRLKFIKNIIVFTELMNIYKFLVICGMYNTLDKTRC